jgi:hypothetical protein
LANKLNSVRYLSTNIRRFSADKDLAIRCSLSDLANKLTGFSESPGGLPSAHAGIPIIRSVPEILYDIEIPSAKR